MAAEAAEICMDEREGLDEAEEAVLNDLLQEAEEAALEQELTEQDPDLSEDDPTEDDVAEDDVSSSHEVEEDSDLLDLSKPEVEESDSPNDLSWEDTEEEELLEGDVLEEPSGFEEVNEQGLIETPTEDLIEVPLEEEQVIEVDNVSDVEELESHEDFVELEEDSSLEEEPETEVLSEESEVYEVDESEDLVELGHPDAFVELETEEILSDESTDLEEQEEPAISEQNSALDCDEIKTEGEFEEPLIDHLMEEVEEDHEPESALLDLTELSEEVEEPAVTEQVEQLEEPDENTEIKEQQLLPMKELEDFDEITLKRELLPVTDEYQPVFTPQEHFLAQVEAELSLIEIYQTDQEQQDSLSTLFKTTDLPLPTPLSVSFNGEILPSISSDYFDKELSTLEEELARLDSPRAFQHFREELHESHLESLTIDTDHSLENLVSDLELISHGEPLPEPPPYDFLAELESYEDDEDQITWNQLHNRLYPYSINRIVQRSKIPATANTKVIGAAANASQTTNSNSKLVHNIAHSQTVNNSPTLEETSHITLESINGTISEELIQKLSRKNIATKFKHLNAKLGKGGGGGGIHPDLLIKWETQLKTCGKYLHQVIRSSGTIRLDELSSVGVNATYKVIDNIVHIKFERISDNNFDHLVKFLSQESAFSPFISKKIESYHSKKAGKDVFVIQRPRHGPLTSILSVSNSYKNCYVTLKIDPVKIEELKSEIKEEITRRTILFGLKMKGYPTSVLKQLDESWVKTLATWSKERAEGEIQTKADIYTFFKQRLISFSIKPYSNDFNHYKGAFLKSVISDGYSVLTSILKSNNPSDMSRLKEICNNNICIDSLTELQNKRGNYITIEKILGSEILRKIKDGMDIDPSDENKQGGLVFKKYVESYRYNNPEACPLVKYENVFRLNLQKFIKGDYTFSQEFSSGSKSFDLFSPDIIIRDKSITSKYNPQGIIVGAFNQKGKTSDYNVHQANASVYEIVDLLLISLVSNITTGFIHQDFTIEGENSKVITYNITPFNPDGRIQEFLSAMKDLLVESVYYRYARRSEIINDVFSDLVKHSDYKALNPSSIKEILSTKLDNIDTEVERTIEKIDEIYGNGGNRFKQLFSQHEVFVNCRTNITDSLMEGVMKNLTELVKMSKYQFKGEWQRNILRGDLLARIKERIQKLSENSEGESRADGKNKE